MASYIETENYGSYANIDALWAAHPEGGVEGAYCTINSVKYHWDKYDRMWVAAPNFGPTPARSETTFDGDVNFQNNVTIAGYLRAKGIKQPCLGLFMTEESLTARWPNPEVGMWALVGDEFPATVYVCETEGVWTETEATAGPDDVELNDYVPKSDIVDDTRTGGTTKVFSAEQGKFLGIRTQAMYSTKSYDSNDLVNGRIWDLKNYDPVSDTMGFGSNFGCMYLSVKAGDSVTVATVGGSAALAWGITDTERNKIRVAGSGADTISTPKVLNIYVDGFVFINCAQSSYDSFSVVHTYNKTLEDIDALEEQASELDERVDALEEGGYETVTCEWETNHYYLTTNNHTQGEPGATSKYTSHVLDCLFVDLTQDFKSIHFRCRGYGYTGSPYYACSWYLLDADDNIVDIETNYNNAAEVTLTLEEVRQLQAVGLYLNNYKSWPSGGVDNPSCEITRAKGSDSGGGGEAECVISETLSWSQKCYFNTSNKTVGDTAVNSVRQSADYICLFVDLTKNFNKISFHCHTAWNGAAPYYFVGSDHKIIEIASTGGYDKTYTNDNIPSGAVGLYINHNAVVYSSEEPYCIVERSVSDTFDNAKSLKGKKVLMFGDSITYLKDLPLGKRYSDYFAEKTGATVYNVGISGSHLNTSSSDPSAQNKNGYNVVEMVYAWLTDDFTNPESAVEKDDTFEGQVDLLKDIGEVDIVTILAGTNDWGVSTIGDSSDADATSFYDNNNEAQNPRAGTIAQNFYSSIKYIVQGILSIYPQTKIYFFTPPVRWIKISNEFTDAGWCDTYISQDSVAMKLSELCEGIMAACKYLHVPCCDVYNGMAWTKYNWRTIAPDGTHPENGMEALGDKVAGFVESDGYNMNYDILYQTAVNTGTETTAKNITAKLLHDNAYIVEETYSSGSLKANKFYDFGTVSSALTIPSLDATNDLVSNALNFYAFRFIAGADDLNITFPTGVIVDDEPTINTGDYVEIMINIYVENNTNHFYASIKVWQAQQ